MTEMIVDRGHKIPIVGLTTKELGGNSSLQLESRGNERIGIKGMIGYWGEPISTTQFEPATPIGYGIPNQGFTHLFRYPRDMDFETAQRQGIDVAAEVIHELLRQSGLRPDEIVSFGLGASSGYDSQPYEIVKAAGLPLNEDQIYSEFAGCDSGIRMFERLSFMQLFSTQAEPERFPVLVMALEDGVRYLTGSVDPLAVADEFALSILGIGCAAFIFEPGVNLHVLASETRFDPDVNNHLAGVPTYTIDPNGDDIQYYGQSERVKMPKPPTPGRRIEMEPGGIIKDVKKFAGPLLEDILTKREQLIKSGQIQNKPLKFISAHHPSLLGLEGVCRSANIDGTKTPVPFVVPDGNSSAATAFIAFLRLVDELEPGDQFILISFGGGYYGTAILGEAGKI